MSVEGEDLHLYSRAVTSNPRYRLHALSTPELEREALAEIRGDVRTAIAGMSFADLLPVVANQDGIGVRAYMVNDLQPFRADTVGPPVPGIAPITVPIPAQRAISPAGQNHPLKLGAGRVVAEGMD